MVALDPVTALAVALLVAGVAGSVLPLLPSGLLSLAGVYAYHFAGSGRIGALALVGFTVVGAVAALIEQFGGAVASKAGGASTTTAALAAVASLVLLFVLGPLGILVGTAGVVLGMELRAGKEPATAARMAAWTVAGMLASSAAQLALTLSMLAAFLAYVFVLG
ncbi:DUF456 domain-containing protein [Halobaculum sp. CBA1158]|uniref:DUF456 domain-containing protein n=1 Tax=Halobaculum sp. CBA1158 TaxID=2904243 RepID=UPI001F1DEC0A|nr:DUF456 domain-containing protein [Halobaculum sp. CBA1158]UIO98554.1 DUF456 domain-containing protein [Halobaculum sp. CBA1158]